MGQAYDKFCVANPLLFLPHTLANVRPDLSSLMHDLSIFNVSMSILVTIVKTFFCISGIQLKLFTNSSSETRFVQNLLIKNLGHIVTKV